MIATRTIGIAAASLFISGASAQPLSKEVLQACYAQQAKLVPFTGVVLARGGGGEFLEIAQPPAGSGQPPLTRSTRFRLASVGKIMTRVAIGQLVDRKKVSLDAPVGTYVPGLPAPIAAVTIDQLLQHRSGVASLTRPNPEDFEILMRARTARDLLPVIVRQPLEFQPGERQRYSNGGFYLLGVVIETVSGKSYGDYLRESLFDPLGMRSTSLVTDERTAVPMTRISGMGQPLLDRARPMNETMAQISSPAGSAVSTVDDLLKLGGALAGDRLLSEPVKARLFPKRGEVWNLGQPGGSLGMNADLTVLPERGWVLALLSNYDPPAGEIMAEVLRGVLAGKGCKPLSAADRPSPLTRRPPAGTTADPPKPTLR